MKSFIIGCIFVIFLMKNNNYKRNLKKVWHFIWEDDSIWSWLVNIGLAFLIIKFLVYPGLGFVLGTDYPVVAVVSGSMEHNGLDFDTWWTTNYNYYSDYAITGEDFKDFPFHNGFNTGDIMVLKGEEPSEIEVGDVLVFQSNRPDPIIHRVIKVWTTGENGQINYHYQTKGDNNPDSIRDFTLNEMDINESQIVGIAGFKIPYLGWIKIGFFKIIQMIMGVI